jgi:hypothetical protein
MQDHNDIYSIVERLRILEEGLTPTSVKHGLNPQQKSVDQLGATFKPKTVAVLTAKKDPKNPMAGKLVGGCEESKEQDEKPLDEAVATEDVLDKVKASFADYLKNVADEIKQDTDLKDKKKSDTDLKKKDKRDRDLVAKDPVDENEIGAALSGIIPAQQPPGEPGVSMKESPTETDPEPTTTASPTDNPVMPESAPVKTVTNECGLWEIHGNEPAGFEIRNCGRAMKSRFKSLDEAEMALEMFAARRRKADESADYIDEA